MLDDADLVSLLDLSTEAALLLRLPGPTRTIPSIVHANAAFCGLSGSPIAALRGRGLRALRDSLGPRSALEALVEAAGRAEPWSGRVELGPERIAARARGARLSGRDDLLILWLTPERPPAEPPDEPLRRVAGLTRESFYVLEAELDCRLRLIWADPRLAELTGHGTAELLETGLLPLVVEADRPALLRRNLQILAGSEGQVTYRLRTRDGSVRLFRDTARPEWSDDKQIVRRIIGAVADITSETGDEVPSVHARLAALAAEASGAPACLIDTRGKLRWSAARLPSPLAASVRELTGQTLPTALSPAAADLWLDRIEAALQSGEPNRARLPWRIGAELVEQDVLLAGLESEDLAIVVFSAADEAAGRGEDPLAAYKALLEATNEALVVIRLDGQVEEANPAFERLLGRTAAELRGLLLTELVAEAGHPVVSEAIERALSRREAASCPALPCLVRGVERPLDLHLAPAIDGQGEIAGLLGQAQLSGSLASAGESEAWFDVIMDSVADGIVTLDAEHRVVWLSRAAEIIFDLPRERAIGAEIRSLLVPSPEGPPGGLDRVIEAQGGRAAPVELAARRRSGELMPVEVEANTLEERGRGTVILAVRDITVRRQTDETLRSLAYHDPITGLPNRLLFHDRLTQAIERAKRARQLLTVMQVDLDRFKLINDSLGLDQGDQVLKGVGERLGSVLRKSDTVARLGADEFLVLLLATTGAESSAKVAQKLLESLRPPLIVNGTELTIEASIGIALFPYDGDDSEALLKNAFTALSRAKDQGRNHYQFYTDDMNARAFERLVLENGLRKALDQSEFVLYYQPKVSLEDGRIRGVEALLRWIHPQLGLVPPGEFIPLAEETGLIVPIGDWVLRTACTQLERWHRMGYRDLELAVNLSARQFQQRGLVDSIAAVVRSTGVEPAKLELELTESVVMRDPAETARRLEQLTAVGIRLVVDDFGTGYSSLAYLKSFPIASLKIDRSFVRDIEHDANSAAIAQAILALARSLSLDVVAEGVETHAQALLLRGYGCRTLQGFVFSKALPADELLGLLREDRRLRLD